MVRTRGPATIIPEQTLLAAYRSGRFPMADSREDDEIFWVDPPLRGILPLDAFHIPKRLARTMRTNAFRITVDAAFPQVMLSCADTITPKRLNTWINPLIERSYANLHANGYAHSIEVWNGTALVGGLYGVSIGAAFFGESMFSHETDASKVALAHLAERLKAGGYMLLDTQFITDHLKQFGAVEIPRARYKELLAKAVVAKADFYVLGGAGAAG